MSQDSYHSLLTDNAVLSKSSKRSTFKKLSAAVMACAVVGMVGYAGFLNNSENTPTHPTYNQDIVSLYGNAPDTQVILYADGGFRGSQVSFGAYKSWSSSFDLSWYGFSKVCSSF